MARRLEQALALTTLAVVIEFFSEGACIREERRVTEEGRKGGEGRWDGGEEKQGWKGGGGGGKGWRGGGEEKKEEMKMGQGKAR